MDIDNIEAYGRNGYFWLKFFEVGASHVHRPDDMSVGVHFFSKIRTRRGRSTAPPVAFIGGKKEMIRLFSQVLKELKKL